MTKTIKKLAIAISSVAVSLVGFVSPAAAASSPVLFGDATLVAVGNPGNAAQLVSDNSPGYGGVDFGVPSGLTFNALTTLSTDYNVTDDDCAGGSPRFVLGIDTNNDNVADGYVPILIGPSPNFTNCLPGWQNTGNLIGNNDAGRYDFSAFGGSPFATYVDAPASVQTGTVVEAFLVVDGGWKFDDNEQTILVDNVVINGDSYTFDPALTKNSCKNGGWKTMTNPGPFKNQGDCVSFFATGGKNPASL